MSDDQEDVGDREDDVEDDQPTIDEDEMADFSAVAEEIEESAGDDDDQEESDDGEDHDDQEDSVQSSTSTRDGDRVTPGDIYCNALGMGAAVARASYGSAEEDERSDLVEEYGDVARDLDIDVYVDQWLEEQGGIDELTPGQAILLSTVMFGGMVAMDDPSMVEGLAGEVGA
jgi:hypothetical protein